VRNVCRKKNQGKKIGAEKHQNGISMDIVVTIPKREYKNDDNETSFLEKYPDAVQFWVLRTFPKNLNIGDRVYFVKNGCVESSMKVIRMGYEEAAKCDVTNRMWVGCAVYMNDLQYEDRTIKSKGFQGFRYKWW
jgi:hypothetical protein